MRRQSFYWTYLTVAIVLTIYGASLLIYNFNHGKGLFIWALVALIIGGAMLILFLILYLISFFQKKRVEVEKPTPVVEEKPVEETPKEEVKPAPEQRVIKTKSNDVTYVRSSYSSSSNDQSGYVKLVGYGPVLDINGNRIRDMRSNTYYRIEGNQVYRDGSGLAFEISGNRIRDAFGGYIFEISGSNINKTFGGFYASVSGNYITKYDSSEKYEMTDSFSGKTLLVIAVLIFGGNP